MSDPTIRELRDSDYEALAAFNAAFPEDSLDTTKWLARFKHWWDDNPAYTPEWKRGFLMESEDAIVGWVGSFPSLFKAGDKVVTAFNGTTWRVLPKYRQWSIDLWSYNREVSKYYLSFNTTPIQEIIPLIKKFRYCLYPWGEDKVSYIAINPSQLVKLRMPKLLKCLVHPIVLAMKLEHIIHLQGRVKCFQVRYDATSDNELDQLWKDSRGNFQNTNVRDSRSVRWYSAGRLFAGVYDSSGMLAWALFGQIKHQKLGHNELWLQDLWMRDRSFLLLALKTLLQSISAVARERNVALIRIPHFSADMSSALRLLKLRTWSYKPSGYLRLGKGQEFDFEPTKTWFTMLQGDYDT